MFSEIASQFTLVLDEFDSVIFKKNLSALELAPIKEFKHLIGFTGSQLQVYHSQLLEKFFAGTLVKYPLQESITGADNKCREKLIFNKRKSQLDHIRKVC